MFKNWNEKKTLVLFIFILVLRALFSWKIPLIDDEAYHWTWTQDLMLSYYDHPAMIAWLEKISLWIFGPNYWGVRFPAYVCFIFTVIFTYKLAKDLFNEKTATITGALVLSSPFWGFGGYVASPEPPFMLAFILAAWIFWQGVRDDEKTWSPIKTWVFLGVVMGLGLNSKFIIALLAPGFGLFLILSAHRKDLLKAAPWLGFLIATILSLPIFLWNIQYDWPGFRYQFYERHNTTTFSSHRWFEWLSAQFIFYTPIIYLLILAAFVVAGLRLRQRNWKFLFCLTLPTLFVFYPQPFFAEYKPHWSGAAHLLLLIGAAQLWTEGLSFFKKTWIQPYSRKLLAAVLIFLIPMNLLIYTPFLGPWMPAVYQWVAPNSEWNPRWDLSNEFYGWEDLGQEVQKEVREYHAESGVKPFVSALRYEITAQTWWGTQDKVYSLSPTKSHFTVMQKARNELDSLRGLNTVLVTTEKYQTDPRDWAYFDQCTSREFKAYRGKYVAQKFTIWRCQNYQGLK